ncbi:adenylate/guanylate cyclase domain-containing protein [Enterovirga aerilata]|uniref:adenylate/guanylate cyclase domain-containing protein n=1 Tax=Enterovirga aerilata TaxID=2730920 RepID=UPI001AEDD9DE|nr:adenylate/guanylate cyclase domain-containing protein [Enterovirga sp. DB1703]
MLSATERSAALPGAPPLKRKIAAILAADVAGYSRLVALDEEGTLRSLAAAREIFDGLVQRAGGRIFNTAGDSVMCEFDSAVEAVRVAIDIQDSLAAAASGTDPARRIAFRIGITIGDVVERGDDLLGDGVNIAARLEGLAPAGGICISRSVHEAVANKIPVEFQDIGARRLKNLPQPIHAFVLSRSPEPLRAGEPIVADPRRERTAEPEEGARHGRIRLLAALGLLLAAGAAAVPGVPMMMRAYRDWSAAETAAPATPPSNLADATPVEVVPAPKQAEAPKHAARTQPAARTPARPPEKAAEKAPDRPAQAEDRKEAAPAVRPMPVAEAAAAFAGLAREGVIAEAKTLPELYHNARFHEARGDRGAALRAYATAAPAAGEAVDLPIRYATLMRSTLGAEAARRSLQELARQNGSRSVALVAAMQAEGADRRARLEALAGDNPDFLPAAYFLAEALMEKRQGGPTLTDRRLAFAALDRFLEGAESGALAPLFIDRTFLEGWVEAARTRRAEIEGYFAGASVRPGASFVRTEASWIARVTLPEPATQVGLRIGEAGEQAPVTSTPARPASSFELALPASLGRTTLYVTYRDLSGREAGPFPLSFDPGSALVSAARETLERNPESWVSFRPDLPDILSYAQLVANRCAIRQALIGFGDEAPSQPLPIPACQPGSPGAAPDMRSVLALPDGTESVQVKLAYQDGTESAVRTFRRP